VPFGLESVRSCERNEVVLAEVTAEEWSHVAVDGGASFERPIVTGESLISAQRCKQLESALLAQIIAKAELKPCHCRRHLDKHLRGHAKCPQHSVNDLC
jgi:hypothetical protein